MAGKGGSLLRPAGGKGARRGSLHRGSAATAATEAKAPAAHLRVRLVAHARGMRHQADRRMPVASSVFPHPVDRTNRYIFIYSYLYMYIYIFAGQAGRAWAGLLPHRRALSGLRKEERQLEIRAHGLDYTGVTAPG